MCYELQKVGENVFARKPCEYDLIINATFQDSDNPLIYIKNSQISLLRKGTTIIDISCDEKMGFEFAKPTTSDNPTFQIGDGITYYGVDHTPSFFWNSASYEISFALIPFLKTVDTTMQDY